MAKHSQKDGAASPFDTLMAQMGVKRLHGHRDKAPRRSAPVPAPEPPPPPPPPPEPPPPVARPAQERSAEREAPSLRARLQAAEDERDSLAARVALLEAGAAVPPGEGALLGDVLGARGLLGADEASALFRALADARLVPDVLPWLGVPRPGALSAFLDDRVCLLCGEPTCPAPPGRAVVRVPPARCDVCGGGDVQRAARRFVDGCLVNGFLRVAVVGGTASSHRQLRELVAHRRLALRLLAVDPAQAAERAADPEVDVVVAWGASEPADGPRLVSVRPGPIARMLEEAAEALLRRASP